MKQNLDSWISRKCNLSDKAWQLAKKSASVCDKVGLCVICCIKWYSVQMFADVTKPDFPVHGTLGQRQRKDEAYSLSRRPSQGSSFPVDSLFIMKSLLLLIRHIDFRMRFGVVPTPEMLSYFYPWCSSHAVFNTGTDAKRMQSPKVPYMSSGCLQASVQPASSTYLGP